MKVQIRERKNEEGDLLGISDVYLNGREVGGDASGCIAGEYGLQTIGTQGDKITGLTGTNKPFEIWGGVKAGGTKNDWFLDIDGVCVCYEINAKRLIQLLCACAWTDEQIVFSNGLYKKALIKIRQS
tara:strand:- start:49 stop:429 length:381 start_codon:yes stop_codon:yes gene_type:complete